MDKPVSRSRAITASILGIGIRFKLVGILLAAILVTGTSAITVICMSITELEGAHLDERVIYQARTLAGRSQDAFLTKDTYALYELMRQVVSTNRHVRYAFILDSRGGIVAHSFDSGVPGDLLKINNVHSNDVRETKISTEEGVIRDAVAPILYSGGSVIRVGVTERLLEESLEYSYKRLMASVLVTSIIALVLSYIIILIFLRPLLDLRSAAQALGNGHFGARAHVWWNDEVGYLATAFNDMAAKLQQLYTDIQKKEAAKTKLLRKMISAQEEERKRIARELHDETSQSLASVNVALGAILDQRDGDSVIDDLRSTISQALERIKNLALELRPGLLDDLGLAAAIDRHVEDIREWYSLSVDFQSIGMEGVRLTPEIETTVYRIVQEALVNAAKHAHASHVSVIIQQDKQTLRALVEDNGQGFDCGNTAADAAGRSLGLLGMRERAALIGGHLRIDSSPGEGTAVALDVPMESA